MSNEKKMVWAFILVLVAATAALLFFPDVEELRAPEPKVAHVAIQPEGAEAAVMGPVELAAGTPFTLHAVLEAETRDGEAVYYTEAPALSLGGETIPPDRLLRWDRPQTARVLWRTVEGARPVLDLDPGDTLDQFELLAFVRNGWPYAWSVPGRLEPANDDPLGDPAAQVERPFGTQRYQVRIELYDDEREQLMPTTSFQSPGPDTLPEQVDSFPTVTATLPGALGPASAVFGLTHVRPPRPGETGEGGEEPAGNASELLGAEGEALAEVRESELWQGLVRLTRQRLAFATLPLLREMVDEAGMATDDLPWGYVDLDAGAAWGEDVHPGDLLRAGDRLVVLYADAAPGQAAEPSPEPGNGVLDRDDLVFDYVFTPAVRPLSEVFEAEGGQLEWLPLGNGG